MSSAVGTPTQKAVDTWLGRWNGPEGTYLVLAKENERYDVTIHDLDAPRTFAGTIENGELTFVRDGARERLYPTDGRGTGMKWLAGKHSCLTVRAGEGYCRD
ncbi:MAG: hypothetical protein ABW034_07405, partial [Steroidobacteraceae bacterium]